MTTTQTAVSARYFVGQRVEIHAHDFATPGMPLVWIGATVTAVLPVADTRLIDIRYRRDDAPEGIQSVTRTGPRGGGKTIRPVTTAA